MRFQPRPRRLRRTTALFVGMAVLSAACGSDESSESSGGNPDFETVRIGQIKHETGVGGESYGIPLDNGLRLGLRHVQESGYLDDVELNIDMDVKDDQTDPTQAVTELNNFIRDGRDIILATGLTPVATALAPIADDSEVLLVSMGSGGGATDVEDYYFRMIDSVDGNAAAIGRYMAEQGHERIAAVIDGDNPGFVRAPALMEAAMAENGGPSSFELIETVSTQDSDFSSILTNVADEDPDALWLGLLDASAGNFLQQMRQVDGLSDVPVYGNGGTGANLAVIAGDAVEGVTYALPWVEGVEDTEKFTEDYVAEYETEPSSFSALGYTTAWLLATAVKMVAEDGEEVNADTVREMWTEAAASDEFLENSLIKDFSVDETGKPSYQGVIGRFDADGVTQLVE